MEEKPELKKKLYYSIGEVAEYFNVASSVLRYWETEFTKLKPRRNRKGNRFYTKDDIEYLKKIHFLLKIQGYTIEGAKKKLSKNAKKIETQSELFQKLSEIKGFLVTIKEQLK